MRNKKSILDEIQQIRFSNNKIKVTYGNKIEDLPVVRMWDGIVRKTSYDDSIGELQDYYDFLFSFQVVTPWHKKREQMKQQLKTKKQLKDEKSKRFINLV